MMQNRHISKIKAIILTVAVVLLLCAISGGVVAAKYFKDLGSSSGTIGAQNFYFTSNLLDGEKHALAPGSTSVTFTLGNHADALRYSDVDIAYTVTVAPAEGITITPDNGVITKGGVNSADVTVSGLQAGTVYTVTAVGSGGYTKTLTAKIEVPQAESKMFYHAETVEGEYTLLTLWNEGEQAGTVTIAYTGIPDNTNPNMADWTTGGLQEVTLQPHESKVFRFFGETTVSVTNAQENELN